MYKRELTFPLNPQHDRPFEDWFPCDDGIFDRNGLPVPGGREIHLKVELLTKPIDGTEALALFDPAHDLHRLYSDFYMALNPSLAMMPTAAVDWLLHEVRMKCGVSKRWHHLLRLAPGLNLNVGTASGKEEMVQVREGRLVALLGCIRDCDASRDASANAVIFPVALGVRQAFRFIQAQVRNGLLMFPYKLAQGAEGDDEYQEPMELRLLWQIDMAIHEQLLAQEQRDPNLGTHHMAVHPSARFSTDQVLGEGLCRLVRLFYLHHLNLALAKDAASGKTKCKELGWVLLEGEVMGKHIKKVVKRSTVLVERLNDKFAHVLPPLSLQRAVEELVSMVTVDVLSLISNYHLRGQGFDAFQEGSEEAMLLKLHLRANHLRQVVAERQPDVACDGLATATAPLLAAWIEKTHVNIVRWIKQATRVDTWEPAAGHEVGGPSSSLIDVFSAAEHACNTFVHVRMAAQVSLRLKFLDLLQNVCCGYLASLSDYAAREHARNLAPQLGSSSKTRGLSHTLTNTHAHTYAHAHAHAHTRMYAYRCIHAHMHMHMTHAHVHDTCTCT